MGEGAQRAKGPIDGGSAHKKRDPKVPFLVERSGSNRRPRMPFALPTELQPRPTRRVNRGTLTPSVFFCKRNGPGYELFLCLVSLADLKPHGVRFKTPDTSFVSGGRGQIVKFLAS